MYARQKLNCDEPACNELCPVVVERYDGKESGALVPPPHSVLKCVVPFIAVRRELRGAHGSNGKGGLVLAHKPPEKAPNDFAIVVRALNAVIMHTLNRGKGVGKQVHDDFRCVYFCKTGLKDGIFAN